ncbi:hypothetical protein [Streptomyces sp. NPDC058861]|uniref:hypothetical protein n=1 Tax=Streptomyces sp. NPDC058861 TaxID=3346653 RepID=UPI00367C9AE5
MREVEIHRLTRDRSEAAYWKSQGVDPHTVVRVDDSGSITCVAPDGTLAPMEGGLAEGSYLAHQIEAYGRGACPLCGGAWGAVHNDAGACPTVTPEAWPLGVEEAARMANVKPATFRSYVARGQAPSPDYPDDDPLHPGKYPRWRKATIEQWTANRPGQGTRTDLSG